MTDDIDIVCLDSAQDFISRCEAALLQFPDLNHNVYQIAAVLAGENPYYSKPYWFCSAESSGHVLGGALFAEPDGLVMSALPRRAVRPILQAFLSSMPAPPRVVACPDCILEASEYLSGSIQANLVLSEVLDVGRLDQIAASPLVVPGHLRKAEITDLDIAKAWGKTYELERPSFVNVSAYYEKKLLDGELYFWDNSEPIVALTVSGRTRLGVRISSVFTAPRHRASGYASIAVATLCDQLLKGHEFVVLTWRNDDLSGNLYRSIGFYRVGQQQSLINARKEVIYFIK